MKMFDRRAVQEDFSKSAKHYAAHATLQATVGGKLIALASPFIPLDALLLDVGAGTGDVTVKWPARAVALDGAFGMCVEAQGKSLPVMQASAEQLSIRNAAVEVVASNLMLQWLATPDEFFAEAARVLKPCGLLAFATFTEGTLAELERAFAQAGEANRISDFIAPMKLLRSVHAAGFEVLAQHSETVVEHYADVLDLCAYLRDIGANNKRQNRPRGMLTMRKLRAVAHAYPQDEHGIAASWNIQIVIAGKK